MKITMSKRLSSAALISAKVWREHGFVSAINAAGDWYSVEHIGIDQGDILLMIANDQDGFVWNLFSQIEPVQRALDAMGFVESTGDYAVPPPPFSSRSKAASALAGVPFSTRGGSR